jgi:hypothetical protein
MADLTSQEMCAVSRALINVNPPPTDAEYQAALREYAKERPADVQAWATQRFSPNRTLWQMTDAERTAYAAKHGNKAFTERVMAEGKHVSILSADPLTGMGPKAAAAEISAPRYDINLTELTDGERADWIRANGLKEYTNELKRQLRGSSFSELTRRR